MIIIQNDIFKAVNTQLYKRYFIKRVVVYEWVHVSVLYDGGKALIE